MIFFILILISFSCQGKTLYVDQSNENGPWDGTSDHPFASIQDAIDSASAFDTISIAKGLYQESIIVDKSLEIIGSADEVIWISANDQTDPAITITAGNCSITQLLITDASTAIYLLNASNCYLSYNTIQNNEIGIKILNDSKENSIVYNNFVNNTQQAIVYSKNDWNASDMGNYWDSYTNDDMNNDSIGDQPYSLSSQNNTDYYPAMNPFNQDPIVAFSYTPPFPTTADAILFESNAIDVDGYLTSWIWDLGDNITTLKSNTTHRFKSAGYYTVTLHVTDNLGGKNTAIKNITVLNIPPTASFTINPMNPTDVEEVSFTDTSTDSDGTIVSWMWDFGDNETSTEQHPFHQFPDDGQYTVVLMVKDNHGASSNYSTVVPVSNVPPIADFSFTYSNITALTNQPISFHDASTDPDGDIVSREWTFGDGSNTSEKYPAHTYKQKGTYTVTLTITDDDGVTKTKTQQITVSDTIQKHEVITEFSLFDAVFVVFLICMIIIVIVLSKKYG